MNVITKLENLLLSWLKGLPHLPQAAQKWLGTNAWWIVLIGAIATGIGLLFSLGALFTAISILGSVAVSYYAAASFTTWTIVTALVSVVFAVAQGLLLAVAVQPLKEKQKKGWVLLFLSWIVGVIAVVVNAVLTLNPLGFIFGLIFGAVWAAISAYFIFEIHGQFAHVSKSAGVKSAKK